MLFELQWNDHRLTGDESPTPRSYLEKKDLDWVQVVHEAVHNLRQMGNKHLI